MRTVVPMSDPIWDTASKVLLTDYPKMCICWIERINNPEVREAYADRREAMREQIGTENVHERVLFHGTKANHIDDIVRDGFKVALNRVSAYGIGTYFATSAAMSASYTDVAYSSEMSFMFVCNVLVGRCAAGHHKATLDTRLYDNTTNDRLNPTIFTTPTDDRAFPEYLVAFYKRA